MTGAPAAGRAGWRRRWRAHLAPLVAGVAGVAGAAVACVAALLAACMVLVINETSYARSTQALARIEQRAQAVEHIHAVSGRLLDAETSQRGYLLTGRERYLAPYRHAAADTTAGLDWLQAYYAGEAVTSAVLNEYREHARTRLDRLAATLLTFEARRREPSPPVSANAGAGVGADLTTLRELSERLLAHEMDAIAADQQAAFETLRASRLGVNLTAAMGALVLLMLLRQARALDTIRARHTRSVQSERERLEADVKDRTADLTELARHLQTVREDESRRLARVLSEELGALFTAARLDLARLRNSLGDAGPDAANRLDHLSQGLDGGIALKRRIIEDLHPSSLANLGLVASLETQLREFSERTGLEVAADLHDVALSDSAQITVYRLLQEALTNIAKYAQARSVVVVLGTQRQATGQEVAVVGVADDGRGFDTGAARRSAHGLMGMRYRVEAVGGTLSVQSSPGRGTQLQATLPLRTAAGPT